MTKIETLTAGLMVTARQNVTAVRASAREIADMIIGASNSDAAAKEFFVACRGEYATCKAKKDKVGMDLESTAYNAVVSAVRYHLKNAGWRLSMPNFRTGLGEANLTTIKDAIQDAKDKAAAEAEADAEARAKRGPAAEHEVSMERIRGMGPQDVADQIVSILTLWSAAEADHKVVLKILTAAINPPKPRSPRKPKEEVTA